MIEIAIISGLLLGVAFIALAMFISARDENENNEEHQAPEVELDKHYITKLNNNVLQFNRRLK